MAYGKTCIEKDLKIETIKGLQAKLRYRERKEGEGPFGLFKETASEEKRHK